MNTENKWKVVKKPVAFILERGEEPYMEEDAILAFLDYSKAQAFADNLNRE